jgi:iron complex transport system ATP-binding protein
MDYNKEKKNQQSTELKNSDDNILLTTNQLVVGYQERRTKLRILEGVNIELKKGELVCLMGQNGIGKSTLLRTLSGVQPPIDGEVKIDGKSIHQLSRIDRAKRISLVLTERLNAGNLTVEDVVVMGRYPFVGLDIRLSDHDKNIIDKSIDLVGIKNLLEQQVNKLSDGQLQKVMITRALVQDGDIIILDEPTAHLDLNNRVSIMRLLKSLTKNTNKVILMATHELDLALQTADRLLLVKSDGTMVEGIPEDLVLDGTLDHVFDLKGFDLKSGQYQHEIGELGKIELIGEGYAYLWTKNALERVGYGVIDGAEIKVSILQSGEKISWELSNNHNSRLLVNSIKELMSKL